MISEILQFKQNISSVQCLIYEGQKLINLYEVQCSEYIQEKENESVKELQLTKLQNQMLSIKFFQSTDMSQSIYSLILNVVRLQQCLDIEKILWKQKSVRITISLVENEDITEQLIQKLHQKTSIEQSIYSTQLHKPSLNIIFFNLLNMQNIENKIMSQNTTDAEISYESFNSKNVEDILQLASKLNLENHKLSKDKENAIKISNQLKDSLEKQNAELKCEILQLKEQQNCKQQEFDVEKYQLEQLISQLKKQLSNKEQTCNLTLQENQSQNVICIQKDWFSNVQKQVVEFQTLSQELSSKYSQQENEKKQLEIKIKVQNAEISRLNSLLDEKQNAQQLKEQFQIQCEDFALQLEKQAKQILDLTVLIINIQMLLEYQNLKKEYYNDIISLKNQLNSNNLEFEELERQRKKSEELMKSSSELVSKYDNVLQEKEKLQNQNYLLQMQQKQYIDEIVCYGIKISEYSKRLNQTEIAQAIVSEFHGLLDKFNSQNHLDEQLISQSWNHSLLNYSQEMNNTCSTSNLISPKNNEQISLNKGKVGTNKENCRSFNAKTVIQNVQQKQGLHEISINNFN